MSEVPADPAGPDDRRVGAAVNATRTFTEREQRLRRTSIATGLLTIGGAVLVVGSLIYSYLTLRDAEERRDLATREANLREAEVAQLKSQKEALGNEINGKSRDIEQLRSSLTELTNQLVQSKQAIEASTKELTDLRKQLEGARCALSSSRSAIEAFHQRSYEQAILLYDESLRCDPGNAYLLNLKAYSEFKAQRLSDAIETQRKSIETDPEYAWGYFDLARFLCASGPTGKPEAKQRINEAVGLRPDLKSIMRGDGEFKRLCGDLVPTN